jgi:MFS family permease
MFTLITPTSILIELHQFSRDQIYILSIVGLISFASMCVLSGYLSDQIQANKVYIIIFASILTVIVITPVFNLLLSGSFTLALWGQFLFGFLTGLHAGPQHIYMQELFPNTNRYSAVAFSFSLGTGILGGLTPQISTILIKEMGSPATCVTTSCLLCISLLYTHRRNQLTKKAFYSRESNASQSKIS